jgi:hypothetical protein
MKEYDLEVCNKVTVSLQKKEGNPVVVLALEGSALTVKAAKSLKTKLDEAIKKAEKIVIGHPELPLK